MNFTRHLFISYAHIDNAVITGVPRGWVDHLQEHLEIRLSQLLGSRPTIWRDRREIKGNYVFNDTIAIGLTETRVFLSVMTPRYLESDACRAELEGFLNAAPQNGGLRLGDKHRVFKLIKTYVEYTEHPEAVRDLLGYEFYARDPISGRFREFDHEIGLNGEKDKRYWEKFEDLAQDICQLLKEMQGAPAPKPGATVFLAETTEDLAGQRDNVMRELRQFGHVILPDKSLPTSKPQIEQLVRGCLQRSRLSVHLIGEHYGFVPDQEPERSVIWMQQDLARERSNDAEFSRLIWLPPGLEPKDDRQRRFIETLQNSLQSTKGSDLIQTKIEDLKTIIQAKLNPPPSPTPTKDPDDGLKRVYLICDPRDLEAIGPLYSYLYEEGCEVMLPSTDETALQSHKQNMLDCDAVLFYYASPPEIWLRTHLRQMTGFGRTRSLAAVGVYVTGEDTPQKKLFMTREAIVIKDFGDFDPAKLNEFMKPLSQAKGGTR